MKKIFIAAAIGTMSSLAVADTAKTIYVGNPANLMDVSTSFGFQADTGRAWVNIVGNRLVSDEPYYTRVNVDGLKFNAETAQVTLSNNGVEQVCANAVERGVGPFKRVGLRATGECPIHAQTFTSPLDTGFDIKPLQQVKLVLKPLASDS
jgi:hypothetical protein